MMNILLKTFKNNMFYIFFFIIILKSFDTFYNTYSVLTSDYEKRMTASYGFCQKESWGFYSFVIKKYNLDKKTIRIHNLEGHVIIQSLFNIVKKEMKENDNKYLIILNFQSTNDQDIYDSKVRNIENYNIEYRYNNCYLMRLDD